MATIYRKTAKGHDEVQTRANRLSPRLRSALIMVDGRRSDEELARLLPQVQETLALLQAQGYIEMLAELAAMPPGPARAAAPAAPGPGAAPSGFAPSDLGPPSSMPGPSSTFNPETQPRTRNFTLIQREAVRRLNDLLGPAAESLAIRMERCKSLDELRPLLVAARRMIASLRGEKAADDYITALSAL